MQKRAIVVAIGIMFLGVAGGAQLAISTGRTTYTTTSISTSASTTSITWTETLTATIEATLTTTATVTVNQSPTRVTSTATYVAIKATTILADYQSNRLLAGAKYGGQRLDINGTVYNVELDQAGNFISCVNASANPPYGCDAANGGQGWIKWYWASQFYAPQNVPTSGASIIAQCVVNSFSGGNLILNNCAVRLMTVPTGVGGS